MSYFSIQKFHSGPNFIAPGENEATQVQNLPKDITTRESQNEEQESIQKGEVEETEGKSCEASGDVNEDEDVKIYDGEAEVVNQDMI